MGALLRDKASFSETAGKGFTRERLLRVLLAPAQVGGIQRPTGGGDVRGDAAAIGQPLPDGVSTNLLYGFGHINLQKPGRDVLSLDSEGDEGYGL
jgi:hypothetical protein